MPLMPKRVKYRKTQRGSRKGTASRNLRIDFGEFGVQRRRLLVIGKPRGQRRVLSNFSDSAQGQTVSPYRVAAAPDGSVAKSSISMMFS